MKPTYRKLLLAFAIVAIAGFMIKDALFQPGIQELPGGFKEVAFVRNEQNKGGIVRIYAVAVADTAQADYLACGNMMPHNDYGSTTTVYFFAAHQPVPEKLQLESPHFDQSKFHPVATYIRNEKGSSSVVTRP